MTRLRMLLLAGLVVVSSANKKYDRLADDERAVFDAVSVWMDEDAVKAFLKLKTPELREQWLKDHKLWDRYFKYDERVRGAINDGRVVTGWTEDLVLMAWGAPHEKRRNTGRNATRSDTYVYRFEVTPDKEVLVWEPNSKATHTAIRLYQVNVIIDDGVVAELVELKAWD